MRTDRFYESKSSHSLSRHCNNRLRKWLAQVPLHGDSGCEAVTAELDFSLQNPDYMNGSPVGFFSTVRLGLEKIYPFGFSELTLWCILWSCDVCESFLIIVLEHIHQTTWAIPGLFSMAEYNFEL